MEARAVMIIAHQIKRETEANSPYKAHFATCLKMAWEIVKTKSQIVVIQLINKAGRKVQAWARKQNNMTDAGFKSLAAAIAKSGAKALGYEIVKIERKQAKKPYMSEPCPHCGTYCWGDCKA